MLCLKTTQVVGGYILKEMLKQSKAKSQRKTTKTTASVKGVRCGKRKRKVEKHHLYTYITYTHLSIRKTNTGEKKSVKYKP